jgi:ribosomal protein S27AE
MKNRLSKRIKTIYKKIEHVFPTDEEKEPCPQCGGCMRHRIHEDSGMSAEAKFGCIKCHYTEFRGGFGSENWLEKIYHARQKSPFLRRLYFS